MDDTMRSGLGPDVVKRMERWMLELAEHRVKYPRFAVRWTSLDDETYPMKCPGWKVVLAPRAWRDSHPELRQHELSDAEFERFYDEWSRHVGILSRTRSFRPDGPRN